MGVTRGNYPWGKWCRVALLGALFVAALGIAPDDGIDPMLEDLGEEIAERPAEVGADVGESAQSGRRGRRPSLRTRGRFAMSFRGGTAGGFGEELGEELGEPQDPEQDSRREMEEMRGKLKMAKVLLSQRKRQEKTSDVSYHENKKGASLPSRVWGNIEPVLGESGGAPAMSQLTVTAPRELLDTVRLHLCQGWRAGKYKREATLAFLKKECAIVPLLSKRSNQATAITRSLKNDSYCYEKLEAELDNDDDDDMISDAPSSEEMAATCANKENWGFMAADSTTFKKGAWSRAIAIGFHGNSKPSEQYRVSPPGCPEPQCEKRRAIPSSVKVLKKETCDAKSSLKIQPVTVSAGYVHTMVVTQAGALIGWGSDEYQKITGSMDSNSASFIRGMKFSSVSSGEMHTCGVEEETRRIRCWGNENSPKRNFNDHRVSRCEKPPCKVPENVKFVSVSVGEDSSCGLEEGTGFVRCWGSDEYGQVSNVTKGVEFSSISAGRWHVCGIEKQTKRIRCWGRDVDGDGDVVGCVSGASKIPEGVKFISVSAGGKHTCGLEEGNGEIRCWGSDAVGSVKDVNSRKGVPRTMKFTSVSCGYRHTCAVEEKTERIRCWGWDNNGAVSKVMRDLRFISVSAGKHYTCGIEKETNIPRCWGLNDNNQCSVPEAKWTIEPSCQTSHPIVSGPASCTSCTSCNPHFTIMDPKTNTGTCTKLKCPACKPKACCDEGHKHYVLNTKNLEGVCVRHTDDCTPVCVPHGINDPKVRRVCTKGCNRILKDVKNQKAKTESEMYDIVTCQADKQVICEPAKDLGHPVGNTTRADVEDLGEWDETGSGRSGRATMAPNPCRAASSFKAGAVCSFSTALWNLGPTCIVNHVEGEKYPQCPDGANPKGIASIKKSCRAATEADDEKCSPLGMSF